MPDQIAAGNMGNSILNIIYGQQNDPAQQMANWSTNEQARNRVAAGTDLQGNLLPTPAPGSQPGVGSGQITGAPQDPTAAMAQIAGTLPPSQEPNAVKTPQSLGSMMIALQRRDEASAGLQQSIGLGLSAFARPENRERVFRSFAPQAPGNPVQLGQALMNMASQQQGQDRVNALGQQIMDPQQGPALAQKLNIGWDELKARYQANPAEVGTMVASFSAPTEATKNYNQARAQMKAQGMTDEQINAIMPPEMLALGGVSDPGYREFVLARTRAIQSGQALPPELQDYPTYLAAKGAKAKLMGDQANDLAKSQKQFAPQVAKMKDIDQLTSSIQNATEADGKTSVLQSILNDPRKKAAAGGAVERWAAWRDREPRSTGRSMVG